MESVSTTLISPVDDIKDGVGHVEVDVAAKITAHLPPSKMWGFGFKLTGSGSYPQEKAGSEAMYHILFTSWDLLDFYLTVAFE